MGDQGNVHLGPVGKSPTLDAPPSRENQARTAHQIKTAEHELLCPPGAFQCSIWHSFRNRPRFCTSRTALGQLHQGPPGPRSWHTHPVQFEQTKTAWCRARPRTPELLKNLALPPFGSTIELWRYYLAYLGPRCTWRFGPRCTWRPGYTVYRELLGWMPLDTTPRPSCHSWAHLVHGGVY